MRVYSKEIKANHPFVYYSHILLQHQEVFNFKYMDSNFWNYLAQLEMMAFFSGFPLVYAVVVVFGGKTETSISKKIQFKSLLPLSYAVVGCLYIGLQLRNLYPDYTLSNISQSFQPPLLKFWAVLSILFLIPFFRKKAIISLLHSMVFFFLLAKDLFLFLFKPAYPADEIKNVMKIYTDSLLLNGAVFLIVLLVAFVLPKLKKPIS
jgi:hypothetical protein